MCGWNFLHQMLWHSLAKLFTKNYENPSICKSYSEKISGTFLCGHGVQHRTVGIPAL